MPELIDLRNSDGLLPEDIAQKYGHTEIVNYCHEFSIKESIKSSNLETTEELIEIFPHLINLVDEKGKTLIIFAVMNKQYEIAKYLIDKNKEMTAKNFDFFKKACLREGMFKLVEKMPVIKDRDDEEEITAQKDESTVFTNMAQVLKHVENTENKHDAVKKLFKKMRQ